MKEPWQRQHSRVSGDFRVDVVAGGTGQPAYM